MTWICEDCGNTEFFDGYHDITEWRTEGIRVKSDGEIIDWFDHGIVDSEVTETHIEKCHNCESKDIKNVEVEELEQWKKLHFDKNGSFIKEIKKSEKPDKFASIEKLRLLNGELLANNISIEEYRRRAQEIKMEA